MCVKDKERGRNREYTIVCLRKNVSEETEIDFVAKQSAKTR